MHRPTNAVSVLIGILSLLSPDDVPADLFRLPEDMDDVPVGFELFQDETALLDAIDELQDLALVRQNLDTEALSMHRLLQSGYRSWTSDKHHPQFEFETAAKLLFGKNSRLDVVRKKADKDLLGTATETFDLPAEHCEFARQCGGIFYENYDMTRFTCPFGSQFYLPEDMAVPLERMTSIFNNDGYFEVAAGWRVGDYGLTTSLYYMLCRVTADMDEPWQWRIGYFDYDTPDMRLWENLPDFLEWYSEGYDRVIWENVEGTIERIHERCLEELEGGQTR